MIQQIARAAQAFEKGCALEARTWLVVFLNEDTIVIALHGSLTPAETASAREPAGARQVCAFHDRMFATKAAEPLLRKINALTGLFSRHTSAAVDLETGSVVQLFTSATAGKDFLLPRTTVFGPPASRGQAAVFPAGFCAPTDSPVLLPTKDRPFSPERNGS